MALSVRHFTVFDFGSSSQTIVRFLGCFSNSALFLGGWDGASAAPATIGVDGCSEARFSCLKKR